MIHSITTDSALFLRQNEISELEREVLRAAEVTTEMLRRARLDGSRRPARLYLNDLRIERRPHKCDYYSYERESGEVVCTDLKMLDYSERYEYPSCGFGKSEPIYVNPYYDLVRNLSLTNNRQLFEEYAQPVI